MDHVTSWGSRLRETDLRARLGDVLSGAAFGAVGAMAMTGMRVITTELGLVEQTPPQAVSRQRARGLRVLVRRAPRKQRRGFIEAAHWAFGAGGGAAFGALPRGLRRHRWSGPTYGLVVWLGFELGIAPVLGLSQAKRVRAVDRLALAADHLLYRLAIGDPVDGAELASRAQGSTNLAPRRPFGKLDASRMAGSGHGPRPQSNTRAIFGS